MILKIVYTELFDDEVINLVKSVLWSKRSLLYRFREDNQRYRGFIDVDANGSPWIDSYNEILFFQLFRLKKDTFQKFLRVLMGNDIHKLIIKQYRGGRHPISPERALLVFLWYMGTQDSLISIAETFRIVPSTCMNIVNAFLHITAKIKKKYIFWPATNEEYEFIERGFTHYPRKYTILYFLIKSKYVSFFLLGTLGAIDGSHVKINVVPHTQQDSYADRHFNYSINIMAICNANKILTYVFIGFPGAAHDSRVRIMVLFLER